jgi:hypothetical protein
LWAPTWLLCCEGLQGRLPFESLPVMTIARHAMLLPLLRLLPVCWCCWCCGRLLLGCDAAHLVEVIKPRLEVLATGLPGANISDMMQEDPALLFEKLESGKPRPDIAAFIHSLHQPPGSCLSWLCRASCRKQPALDFHRCDLHTISCSPCLQ